MDSAIPMTLSKYLCQQNIKQRLGWFCTLCDANLLTVHGRRRRKDWNYMPFVAQSEREAGESYYYRMYLGSRVNCE